MLTYLVYEKQHKLRTMMKMHGLGDGPYWIIYYMYFFIFSFGYMIIFVIIGSILGRIFNNDHLNRLILCLRLFI
jgi:hypothetical protein